MLGVRGLWVPPSVGNASAATGEAAPNIAHAHPSTKEMSHDLHVR